MPIGEKVKKIIYESLMTSGGFNGGLDGVAVVGPNRFVRSLHFGPKLLGEFLGRRPFLVVEITRQKDHVLGLVVELAQKERHTLPLIVFDSHGPTIPRSSL